MPTQNLNTNSVQEQIAYIEQIHISFIDFWSHICDLTRINLSSPQFADNHISEKKPGNHQSVMIEYFNINCFDLLQNINIYLRKQLRIPEYSQMFEDNEEFKQEDFDKETMQIFSENPLLMTKLEKMQKNIIQKIFSIIDMEHSEVKVSLLVYSGFKTLSNTDIQSEWRSLEMLRETRSSFNP